MLAGAKRRRNRKISEENVRLLADDPRIDRVQAVFQYYPA